MPSAVSRSDDLGIALGDPSTLDLERRLTSAAPAPLREKLRAAPVTGERKPVTALFADVVGSTALAESMDPEEWIGVVTQAFEVMAEAAYRYEGTVAQLLGDGLLAFFGAPVAHEDDPERAVRAGLDMVSEIEALGRELGLDLRIRVGINTGLVVVGNVGNDLRYEYTAIGDAVNVAARIHAAAAPGSIVITDDTHRLAAVHFEVVDLGGVEVRGRSEAVRAYEVVGVSAARRSARGVPGLASPLIGRDDELARLEEALAVVRAGSGRSVVIVGEPGIGKTRLLSDLRSGAAGSVVWVEGQCVSYGARLPYGLVLHLVRSLVGAPPPAGDDYVGEALDRRTRELVGDDASDVVRFLRHLLALPLPAEEAEALARLTPARLHSGYVDSIRRLLAAAARTTPVALVCEDVHWSDTASVETLRPLLSLAAEAPLLLLLTSRPDRDAAGWQLVVDARETYGEALTELTLTPLSSDQSRTLVANLLRIEALPQTLRGLILGKGEGNPFFIEEVIRMLVERGVIERRGDDWVAVEGAEPVEIPTTLHGLLLARIDRLSDEAKRALRVASVIGRRFSAALLAQVLESVQLGGELSRLEGGGLVRVAATAPELEYEFRHALVQEAAYDSLLKQERRRLHRAVGEALERSGGADAATLALHFEHGGDVDRATRYLVAAGEHARERFATSEAYELFTRAAANVERLAAGDGDVGRLRIDALLGRARAGYVFMPFAEKLELLGVLRAEAEQLGDRRLLADVHLELARNRAGHGERLEDAAESLAYVREAGELLDDDFLRAQPRIFEGVRAFYTSRFREAIETLGGSIALLERFGDFATASFHSGLVAIAHAYLGEFEAADEWIARVRRLAETSGDPNSGLDADIFEAHVLGERGDLTGGIQLARRGVQRATEVGNLMCEVAGTLAIGEQHVRRGAPGDAVPMLERSGELARECGAVAFAEQSSAWLSAARSYLGDPESGIEGLDEALPKVRELGDRFVEGEILRYRAVARAQAGAPWDGVAGDFEAAIAIFEELGTRPALARALRDYGRSLVAAGREAEGGAFLARAMGLTAELGLAA